MITTQEIIEKLNNHFTGHTFELKPVDNDANKEEYSVYMDGESVYVNWSRESELPKSEKMMTEVDEYLMQMIIDEVQKYIDHISKRS